MEYFGLTEIEAKRKLIDVGPNEIEEKGINIFKKLSKWLFSPITIMLATAAIFSFYLNKIFDFYFIVFLMLINILIGIWHEKKADNAIKKLKENLSINVNVKRDGIWKLINSKYIVPKDIIRVEAGNIIPADAKIVEAEGFTVNESALTGESLTKEKGVDDKCFAGTFVSTGIAIAIVTSTGKNTSFGKTLVTVEKTKKRSLLQKEILNITKFLSIISIIAIIILTVIFLAEKKALLELITLDLSLIIAGIPISLPTVMTLIISVGVIKLTKKSVIVRRIASLENLADVNLLLTDKTGTLTKNEINVVDAIPLNGTTKKELIFFSLISILKENGPIKNAINSYVKKIDLSIPKYKILSFTPHNSRTKKSSIVFKIKEDMFCVSFGAPQVINDILKSKFEKNKFEKLIKNIAKKGYRPIVASFSKNNSKEKIAGILLLSDILRKDSKSVIDFMKNQKIETKIVSGDNIAISRRIAKSLGMNGGVFSKEKNPNFDFSKMSENEFKKISVFSEVLPIDKYNIVEYAKKKYIVAATGDGVNDIPPIKSADVGISVKNGVDALKGAADIIILKEGISVIKDAITEARKIFSRLYTYAIYRISESSRIILTILILGIFYREFPLLPIHLIILAILNDLPIISLAFNKTEELTEPAKTNSYKKFLMGSMFGTVGIINSLIFFFLIKNIFGLNWGTIQTMFFLKLSISGHMLIYVAHTKKHWFKFLPSKIVILTTTITQIIATLFAFYGFLMTKINPELILLVWVWAFIWMQISEVVKDIEKSI